jgi:hypothetical protein
MCRALLPLLAAALAGGPAAAQSAGSVEFSALGVWHNRTVPIDGLRGFGGGSRLGIWLPAGFQLEGQVDVTSLENWADPGTRFFLVHYGGSLLLNIRFRGGGSMYLRGGYGKLDPQEPCSIFGGPCSRFGAATGALGFRIPLAGALQLRAEGMVRNRSVYEYTSFGASMGLTLVSGTRPDPRDLADDDRDGIPNRRDRCPGTPPGVLVNDRGCATDTDGDGVPDGLDRCPATPRGEAVDRFGCPAGRRTDPPGG